MSFVWSDLELLCEAFAHFGAHKITPSYANNKRIIPELSHFLMFK